jgi:DNA-binding LacI/PurR family transcriptional regulator
MEEQGDAVVLKSNPGPPQSADPWAEAERLVRRHLAKPAKFKGKRITAVFAASDAALPALYRALQSAGLQADRDIAVVSCDNEQQVLQTLSPRPASIDIGSQTIGQQAVRHLQWRLASPGEPHRITVVVEPQLRLPADAPSNSPTGSGPTYR